MPRKLSGSTSRIVQVGRRIRRARLEKKMTQAELGNRLGVSFQQIQKYENGTNGLSIERLRQISEALGINANTLADLDDKAMTLPEISRQKIELIEAWDQMSAKYRAPLLQLIMAIKGGQ